MLLFCSTLNCLGPSSRAKPKACIWQNPTWSGCLPFPALLSSPFPLSHWPLRCFWLTMGTLMNHDFWSIFPILLRMLPTPNCHLSHLHTLVFFQMSPFLTILIFSLFIQICAHSTISILPSVLYVFLHSTYLHLTYSVLIDLFPVYLLTL